MEIQKRYVNTRYVEQIFWRKRYITRSYCKHFSKKTHFQWTTNQYQSIFEIPTTKIEKSICKLYTRRQFELYHRINSIVLTIFDRGKRSLVLTVALWNTLYIVAISLKGRVLTTSVSVVRRTVKCYCKYYYGFGFISFSWKRNEREAILCILIYLRSSSTFLPNISLPFKDTFYE